MQISLNYCLKEYFQIYYKFLYSILFSMTKTSMQQYQEFQDYTNYIDTSDVMLGFYKNQPGTGLEKYYLMIEQWLNMTPEQPQDNKPLVIQAEGGVGKKTLLVKWYEYHQELKKNKQNDLIILHFATTGGNNSNYYYAIYRILIKLREELNIGQKVQLHQEKLRNYFSYWLDVCDQKIQNQIIQNVDTLYEKIILVFEGIDYFHDRGTGKQGNIAFWLPKYFPKNVKVIVTADRQSQSMNYFNKLSCPRVNIPADSLIIRTMIKSQLQKQLCVEGEIKQQLAQILENNVKEVQVTSLYVKSYLSCLLPQKIKELELSHQSLKFVQKNIQQINKEKLLKVKNVEDLFDYVLEFWSKILFPNEDKFKELIGLLISTQKGLTRSEIISITKIQHQDLKLFITVFRAFLMNFKDLWMIKNDSFKRSINKKYHFNLATINQQIAEVLKKTPNSVRKLEEQTFQLYSAGNYFKLKQVISDIQNFLLLFNPYTKYDLCRYWQKLEEKSFDPVIQYNKAIEGFEMHYHPTSDDLFRIITQISRFLKQFSDFQNYYTPQFRHPQIIGNSSQLDDIGILGQFKNLQLCQYDEEQAKKQQKNTEQEYRQETTQNQEQQKFKKKLKEMYDKIEEGKHIKKINKIQIQTKPKDKSKKDGSTVQKKKKQKQCRIQQLNVEVKSNQVYFREHYYNQIKPFLQKVSLEGQKQMFSLDQGKDEEYDDSEEENETDNIVAKIKNIQKDKEKSKFQDLPDLKNLYAKTVQQEFELNQKPPTNYYYKRWIWMQFPWVCMTMKSDYSDKLRKCFTSPTSYMSVSQQRQFTIQALKIALQAKKKKQAILQKSEQPLQKKKSIKDMSTIMNETSREERTNNQNSYIKGKFDDSSIITSARDKKSKKLEQLGFVTNSFLSLHNLSKQMENLNCSVNNDKKVLDSRVSDSKGTLFITADQKNSNIADQSSFLSAFNKKKKKNITLNQDVSVISQSRQGLLPRIKQNVNTSMIKQLEELQKNNAQIRKNMDTYLYKNKILAKRLKQLKIIQYNNKSQLKNQKKIQEKKSRISQIQQKIQKVKYQYAHSLLEHQRLDVLIKICKRNKTHNEEKIPDLVLECNNFKKMIKIESEAIHQLKKKTDQIKKLTKKFVSNYCEKIQNQMQLQEQIKQTLKNRQNFKDQVEKYDKMINQQIQEKRKQLNDQILNSSILQKQQKNSSHYDKAKKWSNNSDQENYEQMYEQIMEYLDVQNQNYREDPKYVKLMEGLHKKRQFERVIQERKMQLDELKKKEQQLKRQLQTLDKAKQESAFLRTQEEEENDTEQQIGCNQTEEELEKQLYEKKRSLTKTTQVKLACLGMLNTWYNRLGLGEQKSLVITPQFLERLQQIQIMNKVEAC